MTDKRVLSAAVLLLLLSVHPGMAAIRLAAPFGEHMVLQQGVPVPIWGTGAPGGDTVRVAIAGQSVTAKSDWAGRWMVILAPMKAGGPYQLLIEIGGMGPVIPSSAANSSGGVELNDVVIGELRVAPRLSGSAAATARQGSPDTARTPSSWIRVFRTPARADGSPTSAPARWTVPLAGTAGNYSVPPYALARELYQHLQVPIGVIENPTGP